MQGVFLRKYGVETIINFDLFNVDGVDFNVAAVFAAGDLKIMKNDGAEADTDNGFVDRGKGYSLVLSAAEMQAKRIVIYVVDITATKEWLDKSIVIDTYGNTAAMHAFDLGTDILTGALTEGYAADGAEATLPQILYMVWSMLNSLKFVSTAGVSRKLDGTTEAMTFTLDDATTPTDINRTT
jgi:hypothetical protein